MAYDQPMYASHSRPPKSFNTLAVNHTITSCWDNTHSVRLKKHCTKAFTANERNCNWLPKQVHFDQFRKQVPKIKTRLPLYIDVILPELPFITETFVLLLLEPRQKLGSLLTWYKVCHIILGFEMGSLTIQILRRVKVDMKALMAKKFGHAFQKHWDENKWIYKMQVLHTHILRILVRSIAILGTHLSSRYLLNKNCASYPRELLDVTRELYF